MLKSLIKKLFNPYKIHVATATTKKQLQEATQILLKNNIGYQVVALKESVTGVLLQSPRYNIHVKKEDVRRAKRHILTGC